MAEIRYEGQIVGVTGLASLKGWSQDHGLTKTDEDRLIDLDLLARRRSLTQMADSRCRLVPQSARRSGAQRHSAV